MAERVICDGGQMSHQWWLHPSPDTLGNFQLPNEIMKGLAPTIMTTFWSGSICSRPCLIETNRFCFQPTPQWWGRPQPSSEKKKRAASEREDQVRTLPKQMEEAFVAGMMIWTFLKSAYGTYVYVRYTLDTVRSVRLIIRALCTLSSWATLCLLEINLKASVLNSLRCYPTWWSRLLVSISEPTKISY